jgi:hypothetical protein
VRLGRALIARWKQGRCTVADHSAQPPFLAALAST